MTARLFEERLCELVRSFKHLYDVSSPGQTAVMVEQKLQDGCYLEWRPLVVILLNIQAKVWDT